MKTFKELGFNAQDAKDFCARNECLVCNGAVFIAFIAGEHVLRCGDPEHGPEQWGRPSTKPNMYQEANQIKRSLKELEKEIGTESTKAVATILRGGPITQARASEIIKTIWPKAPDAEVLKAAMYCKDYGLNPLAKHIALVSFKNKNGGEDWAIIRGISADRLIAKDAGDFSYIDDTPRVMTSAEQTRKFGAVDDTKIWAITKLRNVLTNAESTGIGGWPRSAQPYGVEKGNSQFNMACIRSERQALDRLCPGKIPNMPNVQVVDDQYIDIPQVGHVNKGTGVIEDGDFKVVEEAPTPTPAAPAVTPAFAPDTEMCPIHNVESKRNKYGGFSHKLDDNGPRGIARWCNRNKPKDEDKPPAPESTDDPTDDSTGDDKTAPAASTEQTGTVDEPGREAINTLAEQLYGKENWQPSLRNFLKSSYGLASRNAIKEAQIPDIIKKLTEMVNAMK
jgi:hypothetical protein